MEGLKFKRLPKWSTVSEGNNYPVIYLLSMSSTMATVSYKKCSCCKCSMHVLIIPNSDTSLCEDCIGALFKRAYKQDGFAEMVPEDHLRWDLDNSRGELASSRERVRQLEEHAKLLRKLTLEAYSTLSRTSGRHTALTFMTNERA